MMPVFPGDGVPSGIKKPRARTGRNACVCVGWGGGMERERAPHRMFCFGRTHVQYVDARQARRRMRMLHASAISIPVPHTGPRPTAPGPDNSTGRLPCVGAGFWIGTCECDGCGEEVDGPVRFKLSADEITMFSLIINQY
jgi:hypothetical protein